MHAGPTERHHALYGASATTTPTAGTDSATAAIFTGPRTISRTTAMRVSFPQCTSYSVRPLYPRESRETTTSTPPLVYTAPPYNYKRRRWASFSRVGLSLSGFSLPRGRSGTTKHSFQSTPLLAETWEFPSLSRLACIPYYKHSGCKIIQCPRTPPLLDVRPCGRNQDKPCVTVIASCIIIWDEEIRSIY